MFLGFYLKKSIKGAPQYFGKKKAVEQSQDCSTAKTNVDTQSLIL
jgi:hypothetical protein